MRFSSIFVARCFAEKMKMHILKTTTTINMTTQADRKRDVDEQGCATARVVLFCDHSHSDLQSHFYIFTYNDIYDASGARKGSNILSIHDSNIRQRRKSRYRATWLIKLGISRFY